MRWDRDSFDGSFDIHHGPQNSPSELSQHWYRVGAHQIFWYLSQYIPLNSHSILSTSPWFLLYLRVSIYIGEIIVSSQIPSNFHITFIFLLIPYYSHITPIQIPYNFHMFVGLYHRPIVRCLIPERCRKVGWARWWPFSAPEEPVVGINGGFHSHGGIPKLMIGCEASQWRLGDRWT